MNIKTIRDDARKKLNGTCRVCPVCDGRVCAGETPGMGGTGTGDSFKENVRALAAVKLNMRVLHGVLEPNTSATFFGKQLKTPIMAAPICNALANTGGGLSEEEMVTAFVEGSDLAGSLGWIGDPADASMYSDAVSAIKKVQCGVAIIKPRVDTDSILERFEQAQNAGAIAVGLDIDGAGLLLMKLKGQAVGPKTPKQIAELVKATTLPFIVKGIMTVDEAVACAEAGVHTIVVSNHGGRVLDHTPGTATVLPAIAKAVKGKVNIIVDGGVRCGADALKMIGLGADGVLVGRPLIVGAYGGGAAGVKLLMEKYTSELYAAMILTGCASIDDISSRVIA